MCPPFAVGRMQNHEHILRLGYWPVHGLLFRPLLYWYMLATLALVTSMCGSVLRQVIHFAGVRRFAETTK
jgi:hypothetical protein